jgi:hypothetical protein
MALYQEAKAATALVFQLKQAKPLYSLAVVVVELFSILTRG